MFLCTAGLGLLRVTVDLLHDDSLVLRVITHLVADVEIRALPRALFVGTFGSKIRCHGELDSLAKMAAWLPVLDYDPICVEDLAVRGSIICRKFLLFEQ